MPVTVIVMKTTALGKWAAVGMSVLTLAAYSSPADQTATAAKPDKTCTGTVASVHPDQRTLEVKGFLFSKTFNIGNSCTFALLDKPDGSISDMRPGEKVVVSYQSPNGVLVADSIRQKPMDDTGTVKAIDPAKHTITMHSGIMDKTFRVPDDCVVVLHNDKSGTVADVQPGDHVIITYETPDGKLTARQIAQTSATFTGELTAIDLGEKTLKAKATFDSKKFHLGDNCTIVLNGKLGGHLTDLRPGEKLTFNYDTVNGVNIVNRIADAQTAQETAAAQ